LFLIIAVLVLVANEGGYRWVGLKTDAVDDTDVLPRLNERPTSCGPLTLPTSEDRSGESITRASLVPSRR
jgi:hypothetical protein